MQYVYPKKYVDGYLGMLEKVSQAAQQPAPVQPVKQPINHKSNFYSRSDDLLRPPELRDRRFFILPDDKSHVWDGHRDADVAREQEYAGRLKFRTDKINRLQKEYESRKWYNPRKWTMWNHLRRNRNKLEDLHYQNPSNEIRDAVAREMLPQGYGGGLTEQEYINYRKTHPNARAFMGTNSGAQTGEQFYQMLISGLPNKSELVPHTPTPAPQPAQPARLGPTPEQQAEREAYARRANYVYKAKSYLNSPLGRLHTGITMAPSVNNLRIIPYLKYL